MQRARRFVSDTVQEMYARYCELYELAARFGSPDTGSE